MSDGIVMQCARVERVDRAHVLEGSKQVLCVNCRARCWISKAATTLIQGPGIKPVCDICQPASPVGYIKPDKISGE